MKIDKILEDLGYSYGSENFEGLNDIFIEKYNEYHAQKDDENNKNEEFDIKLLELHEQLHDVEEFSEELAAEKTKNLLLEKKMKKKAKQEEKQAKELAEKQAKELAEKQAKEQQNNEKKQGKYLNIKDLEALGIPKEKYIGKILPSSFEWENKKYKVEHLPSKFFPIFSRWIKE